MILEIPYKQFIWKVRIPHTQQHILPTASSNDRSSLELRNELAHNITNLAFSFAKYVSGYVSNLDSQQQPKSATEVWAGTDEDCEDQLPVKFILTYPRISIWLTGADVLLSMHDKVFQPG